MKKASYSWAALLLFLVFCASLAWAQTPVVKIKIEGYSPQEIHDLGYTSPRSTGLKVVGVGQVVYLVGRDSLNATVNTYAWTLTGKPAGSIAVLDSTNQRQTTFKPDAEGPFTVQLVINTAGGASAPRSIVITSAKFVGVGGMDGLPVDFAAGQCALCHNANFLAWEKTKHSTFFTRAIDGLSEAGTFYNESCIECHTTGFDDSPDAVNDGFDDVQDELGWVFPATLQAGNWDSLKANYPKLAHRANIQCESCHGPGSQHKGIKDGIAMSLDEAACGYCHEEAPYHRIDTQWKNSVHGIPSAEFESVANRPVSSGCYKCHSAWGFIRRVDPKIPDNRPTTGFSQISCAVCHDPHRSDVLESQLRTLENVQLGDTLTVVNYGGKGKICMQCHISRRDAADYVNNPSNLGIHFGPHYSNQADMIDGSNAIEYGLPTGSSGHKFAIENACVDCHMQETPADGQPGRDKVGEHTYAMTWDGGTPDNPADDFEHVAVCQTCHGPIDSFDDIMAKADWDDDGTIESTRHEIEGLLHRLDELLPPNSTPNEVNANYKWAATDPPAKIEARKLLAKAWFNFRFVEEDRSMGVHNAGYAITLLRRSIASITTGSIGAAEIISITDVPNDQGKQVRLAWDGFPGDGIATDAIANYSLWRRVDDVAGKVSAQELPNKEALYAAATRANVGKRFKVAQVSGWWDFVGIVPASSLDVYSTVAPTLYDSTAAGVHWSVFYVAGHRRSGQTVETAPDSGYSVDNLAPVAPGNVAASVVSSVVNLTWDDPIDADFKYFAVYRSTTNNFDPKGTTPLATLIGTEYADTDVVVGTTYYYRLSAYDFAGNESAFSPEITTLITHVQENAGVPTEFALQQNYPNPFNPETSIQYQLPLPGHVRLSIYTVLGQEIRTLVDRSQPAAYHTVVWDGRDNTGNPMPSGVYFYRIESGGFTAVKKMLLMK
jgi:hypothetical protein